VERPREKRTLENGTATRGAQGNNRVSISGGVKSSNIMGAHPLSGGALTGEYILNPNVKKWLSMIKSNAERWPLTTDVRVFSGENILSGKIHRWDEWSLDVDAIKIRLEMEGAIFEVCSEHGYFRALCTLRIQLESRGLLLECYGGSENVYPSPMIEAMGCGEKAYKLTLRRHASAADIVSIFDVGPDVRLSTVVQQKEFYKRWLTVLS
jgi:hypothetical protein